MYTIFDASVSFEYDKPTCRRRDTVQDAVHDYIILLLLLSFLWVIWDITQCLINPRSL